LLAKILLDKDNVPKDNLLYKHDKNADLENDNLFDGVDNLKVADEHQIKTLPKKKLMKRKI
jgi:hypothetical protein